MNAAVTIFLCVVMACGAVSGLQARDGGKKPAADTERQIEWDLDARRKPDEDLVKSLRGLTESIRHLADSLALKIEKDTEKAMQKSASSVVRECGKIRKKLEKMSEDLKTDGDGVRDETLKSVNDVIRDLDGSINQMDDAIKNE